MAHARKRTSAAQQKISLLPEHSIVVPVTSDGWTPRLKCGEFAVIDTSDTRPERDKFVLIRGSRNRFSLVQITLFPFQVVEEKDGEPAWTVDHALPGGGYCTRTYWQEQYGAQRPLSLAGKRLEKIHMCDGPVSDKLMRERIVGTVRGVWSHNGRLGMRR